MDSSDILLLTGVIVLLGSITGLSAAALRGNSFFTAGCIVYGFWIIYFAVPMLDMPTRREMEPILYASSNDALEGSCYAVLLGLVILSFVYFGQKSPLAWRQKHDVHGNPAKALPHWFVPWAFLLLIAGSVGKWQVISSYGGVSIDLLLNLSASVRHAGAVQVSAIAVFIASLFDAGLYMLIFYYILMRQQYVLASLLVGVGVLSTLIIGGKRIAALGFVVAAAIWYIRSRQPSLRAQLILVLAAIIVSIAGLLARIAIPTWLLGSAEHAAVAIDTVTRPMHTVLDSGELSLFEGTNVVFESRESFISGYPSGLYLLVEQTLACVVFFVPRAFWPNKPEAFDFSQMLYALTVGDDRSTGFGIGLVGVGYIWGEWIGVMLTALAAGIIARWIDARLITTYFSSSLLFVVPFVLLSFFHLLRFGAPGFVLVNVYLNLIPLVAVFFMLWMSERRVVQT